MFEIIEKEKNILYNYVAKGEGAMKLKSLKIIIAIFVLFVIVGIVYGVTHNIKDEQQENKEISYRTVNMITNIRLGISNFDSIHPYITNNQEAIYIDQLIFEPLLTITEDYKISNCLAQEWSKIGNKTYLIKKENVQKNFCTFISENLL